MPIPLAPEYRRCPITGRTVVIAPVRAARPLSLGTAHPHHREWKESHDCPLCEGAEVHTPHEVYAVREPGMPVNGKGWSLRVVPNKYPAVSPAVTGTDRAELLFRSEPAVGVHELVIECARHESNPSHLTDDEFAAVLTAYRHRLIAHADDPRLAYAAAFKNVGDEAGASLAHLHSQILATPTVPDAVAEELRTTADYYRREGRCVFCDVIGAELDVGERVVAVSENAGFVALCPFAPRFAYEVWILPTAHESRYESLTDAKTHELSKLMKRVLAGVDRLPSRPAYNYFLHTAPLRSGPLPHYHWHLEIIPRTARAAGFEWATGCFINAVPPEVAAVELR